MKTLFQKPSGWVIVLTGLAWAMVYLLARRILGGQLAEGLRVTVALLPIVPFALFLAFILANTHQMEERPRRIQLEALAVAFLLAMLLFMLLGLLELVIPLSLKRLSYRQIWYVLPLFYFIGLAAAWRRYR